MTVRGNRPETPAKPESVTQPKKTPLTQRQAFAAQILKEHPREYYKYSMGKFIGVQHKVIGGGHARHSFCFHHDFLIRWRLAGLLEEDWTNFENSKENRMLKFAIPCSCVTKLLRNPLFWCLFIAIAFRGFIDPQGFLDPKRHGKPNAESPDVPSYLEPQKLASIVWAGEVNTVRTPIYPLFIDLHRNVVGEEHLFEWIVFSQRMISLLSVFFFYRIAEYFIRRKGLCIMATLAYVGLVSVLLFNNWILTESLSVSGVVIWFYGLTIYVQRPSPGKASLIGLGVFLLIMLRPAFLGLLLLLFVFWIMRLLWQQANLKTDMIGLLSALVILALVLGYSHLVRQKTGIFNVSVVGASNQYICVIQSGLFQNDDSPVGRCMTSALKDYLELFPEKADDPRLLSRPRIWTYPNDPINYISTSVEDTALLPTLKDKADYAKSLISSHKSQYAGFIVDKFLRQKIFYPVYVLHLLEAVLILSLWKNTGKLPILHGVFWLLIAGLLFTAIAGAQDEYLRLSLPVLPFVVIIPFQLLDAMIKGRTVTP